MFAEPWDSIVGFITMLMGACTLYVLLRDRGEHVQVILKRSPSKEYGGEDPYGGPVEYEVPGFEVVIRNRGKTTLYVSEVYLCCKQSSERLRCSFGAVPLRDTSIAPISGFANRYSFEIKSGRSVKRDFPTRKTLGDLKVQDREKVSLYVVVELESSKTIHSKNLTMQTKAAEPLPPGAAG